MKSLTFDRGNMLCGALFVAFGVFFLHQTASLNIGTAFRMGPGYFPLVLSSVLILLGVIIAVQALRVEGEPVGPIALRGMVFILPAPIIFGLTVRGLGFVLAVMLCALVAAFASARMKPLLAVALSLGVTAFSVAVFSYALGLPFERFGPWTRMF